MKPETAPALEDRLQREINGLQTMLSQFENPETATTLAGLRSAAVILTRSLHRTNRILHDVVRASVVPPASNPFEGLFGPR